MKKIIALLLSLTLTFNALFVYTPLIVYADEEETTAETADVQVEEPVSDEVLEEELVPEPVEVVSEDNRLSPESDNLMSEENIETQDENKVAPEATIIENGDGQLIVSCDDTEWLEKLQKGRDSSTSTCYGEIHLQKQGDQNYSTISNWDESDEFVLSEDHKTLTISNSKYHYLANGDYSVSFVVQGYDNLSLDAKLTIIHGLKNAPNVDDIQVSCENNQIIITAPDDEWLKGIAEEWVSTKTGTGEDCESLKMGGRIIFHSSGYGYYDISNFRRIVDGYTARVIHSFDYEDGKLIVLAETVFSNHLVSGEYRLQIEVPGVYTRVDKTVQITSGIKTELPNNISVDYDGGIIVTSSDKEWLAGLAHVDNCRHHIEIYGFDASDDRVSYDARNTDNYHLIDFDGNRIYISEDDLINYCGIAEGDYYLSFESYGYLDSYNTENIFHFGKKAELLDEITVSQNNNGDLIVASDDKDFLRALTVNSRVDSDNRIVMTGARILLKDPVFASANAAKRIGTEDKGFFINTSSDQKIYYDEVNGCVVIKGTAIADRGLTTGTYNVWLYPAGYSAKRIDSVAFDFDNIQPSAPINTTIKEDENGNLVIDCAETDWVKMLCKGHNEQTGGNYGELVFSQNGKQVGFSIVYGMEGIMFERSNNDRTVTIPNQLVRICRIPNGEYDVAIKVEGYEDANFSLTITKSKKAAPSVEITSDNDNIYITSSDADYLDALYKANPEGTDKDGKSMYVENAYIEFSSVDAEGNYDGVFSTRLYNSDIYENGEKKITSIDIEKEEGRLRIFDKRVINLRMPSGRYKVTLFADDYFSKNEFADLTTSIKTNTPTDIDISFDPAKGVLIKSSDTEWLDAIVKGSVGLNLDPMGGYWFSNYDKKTPLTRNGDTVTIGLDYMVEQNVPTADFMVYVEPDHYVRYKYGSYDHKEQKVVDGLHVEIITNGVEYTVTFNANGGKGKMAKQAGLSMVEMALNENQFAKAGYRFAGWSTVKNGPVEYADKGMFSKYFKTKGSVTLYAVWEQIYVTDIAVTGNAKVAAGKSITLKALVEPTDAANKAVVWSIEKVKYIGADGNPVEINKDQTAELKKYATVSSGKVTAKKVAQITDVTVRATAKDGSGIYGEMTVTIVPAVTAVHVLYNGEEFTGKVIGVEQGTEKVVKLSANTDPIDASKEVTWASSNTKIAYVDGEGNVTIPANAKIGKVKITAKALDGTGKSASVTINVAKLVSKITLSGPDKVAAGKSIKLTAVIKPAKPTNKALNWFIKIVSTKDATYTENADIKKYASVSSGKVTAKKVSEIVNVTVVAQAKDGSGIESEYVVTIVPAVSSVSILRNSEDVSKTTIGIDPGVTSVLDLSATTSPADASKEVTWTSSNTKLATVENGKVTIVGAKGKVKITAKATDGTGKNTYVTLNVAKLVTKITLSGSDKVAAGKSVKLTAAVEPTDAANKAVVWSIEKVKYIGADGNPVEINKDQTAELKKYATVSSGKVTAKKVAQITDVTVRATAKDGSGIYGEMTVTIVPAVTAVHVLYNGEEFTGKVIGVEQGTEKVVKLSANTDPIDASKEVTWASSNTKIAYVDGEGNVTIPANAKIGKVKITAKALDGTGKSASVTINVAKLVTKITVYNSKDTIKEDGTPKVVSGNAYVNAGEKTTLKAKVDPSNATSKAVSWSISRFYYYNDSYEQIVVTDPKEIAKYASVSTSGVVTTKKLTTPEDKMSRNIIVRATAKDGSEVYGEYRVRVTPVAESIAFYLNDEKLEPGATVELTELPNSVITLLHPSGARGIITISSSAPDIAYSDEYQDIQFTGNKGTVTLTATSSALKGVSVSVTFIVK